MTTGSMRTVRRPLPTLTNASLRNGSPAGSSTPIWSAPPTRCRICVRIIRRCESRRRPRGTAGASIYRNSRFQRGAAAGLSPGQVSRLQLKWAFGFPGATALYGQTVYDGRLYVTSNAGYVYSLDAETGCLHWGFRAQSAVRSGFTIGRLSKADARLAIFFGDIHGTAYALSATTGEEIWKTLTDPHPLARITGTPVLFEDGCTYRLRRSKSRSRDRRITRVARSAAIMSALDAATGREIWKTYTIPEAPRWSARTRAEKTCSSRPVPASGRHRRST